MKLSIYFVALLFFLCIFVGYNLSSQERSEKVDLDANNKTIIATIIATDEEKVVNTINEYCNFAKNAEIKSLLKLIDVTHSVENNLSNTKSEQVKSKELQNNSNKSPLPAITEEDGGFNKLDYKRISEYTPSLFQSLILPIKIESVSVNDNRSKVKTTATLKSRFPKPLVYTMYFLLTKKEDNWKIYRITYTDL